MNAIHGRSHAAIRHFKKQSGALEVYWIYVSRINQDNVSWPSLRGLVRDTGWSINTVTAARQWLIDHKALIEIADYVRPEWRALPDKDLARKLQMDRSVYCRPTGYLEIENRRYPVLYIPGHEPSDIELDVSPGETSPRPTSDATRHRPGDTELNTNIELDTPKQNLVPDKTSSTPDGVEADRKAANKAASALIKAWLDAAQVIDPGAYQKKGVRSLALALHEAGVTPDDVTAFVADKRDDDFWCDKRITLKLVADEILPWKAINAPEDASAPYPDMPVERPPDDEIDAAMNDILNQWGKNQ